MHDFDLESQQQHQQQQSTFIDKDIVNHRTGFIRKVYGIISMQLLLTTFVVILGQTSLSSFFHSGTFLPTALFILSVLGAIISMFAISCWNIHIMRSIFSGLFYELFRASACYFSRVPYLQSDNDFDSLCLYIKN